MFDWARRSLPSPDSFSLPIFYLECLKSLRLLLMQLISKMSSTPMTLSNALYPLISCRLWNVSFNHEYDCLLCVSLNSAHMLYNLNKWLCSRKLVGYCTTTTIRNKAICLTFRAVAQNYIPHLTVRERERGNLMYS